MLYLFSLSLSEATFDMVMEYRRSVLYIACISFLADTVLALMIY